MKTPIDTDGKAILALYFWARKGKGYLRDLQNESAHKAPISISSPDLRSRSVHLHIASLLEAGIIESIGGPGEGERRRGKAPKFIQITERGKIEVSDYLKSRLRHQSAFLSQAFFFDVVRFLWDTDRKLLAELLEIRFITIVEEVDARTPTIPKEEYVDRYIYNIVEGSSRIEQKEIIALRRVLLSAG